MRYPVTGWTGWDGARLAHNPEVAGSNPAPAAKARGPFSNREGAFCLWFVHGFAHGAPVKAALPLVPSALSAISVEASEPPMISCASVLATWRPASRSVWTYCFMVNATQHAAVFLARNCPARGHRVKGGLQQLRSSSAPGHHRDRTTDMVRLVAAEDDLGFLRTSHP
jgi:hypothetical protein